MAQSWQSWIEDHLPPGTRISSGYRTPQEEAALGGPSTSYHTKGSPGAPGALDIAGPAGQLKILFDEIKQAFKGRLNELYLNVPGASEDIRHNQPLGHNPEAGRPIHLHAAISPVGALQPASAIPSANRGEKAVEAAGGECARSISWTTPAGWVSAALGKEPPEGAAHSICWSDVWVYGAAMGLVLGGFWLTFRGKGNGS